MRPAAGFAQDELLRLAASAEQYSVPVLADAIRAAAEERTGSWWEPWAQWTVEQCGDEVPAPTTLGSAAHPPLADAPAPGANGCWTP